MFFSTLKKILKITGIVLVGLLVLLFLAPYIFPNTVEKSVKQWANNSIKGELNFSKVRLSFFNHFPSLTISLHDFTLKGSKPFEKDTLIQADKISFGINVRSLIFDKEVTIDKIILGRALVNVQINEKGEANYNIYESRPSNKPSQDSSSASLKLNRIIIRQSHLIYNDRSVPMSFEAKNLNYEGRGDLSKAIFGLRSQISIDSLNFILKNQSYLTHKKIDATLVTKINTNSLAFVFEKNDLRINKLALQFSGKLDFLKNGYEIDAAVSTNDSKIYDLITACPPQYLDWLEKTKVKGTVSALLTMKGRYIASTNQNPTLRLSMKVRDGYISYQDAPVPASNLRANLDASFPSFDTDSLRLKADSVRFTLDKNYFLGQFDITGLDEPTIHAKADGDIDLEQLNKALGVQTISAKGRLQLKLNVDGKYARGVRGGNFRKKDSGIVSIPNFEMNASLHNGYLKYKDLPNPITDIYLIIHSSCKDNRYENVQISLDTLQAKTLNNFILGSARITRLKDLPVEAHLLGKINLADIKKCYPLDSLELSGILDLQINSHGKYAPEKKLFPLIKANIGLTNGLIQTRYSPVPIENIDLTATATDGDGTLNSLELRLEPLRFQLAGNPFVLHAHLAHFNDLFYDVQANGELDIGKIYRVFGVRDVNLEGYAKMNVVFRGTQSDALNGQLDKIHHAGKVEIKNLGITHVYFPKPFIVQTGAFSFRDDKMWFDQFEAHYGKSDFKLDGYLEDAIGYFLMGRKMLKGNFNLKSNVFSVDEFTAFSGSAAPKGSTTKTADTSSAKGSGVVMIPENLDLTIHAEATRVDYNNLDIRNFTGGLTIQSGRIQLNETSFNMIGCSVNMDGLYGHSSPTRAYFEYHLQARDFDVNKAYNEVKIFHDLASSAAKAQGIISLDYHLKGRLNENMYPIYPSLNGGGVVSIKNVKVKGLKLFNEVGSKTNKSEINDPELSKIDLKSNIRNNIITLDRVKFKTSGFRIRLEGQSSFDGKLNLKMRIGLPPLGIIGIPLTVTGSSDNPKIKLGKNDKEELEEKEDTE
ncbi:MAG: hypothetical protein C5B59_02900 [Bacteroidetes bacterium]|nr:MAG: hypothetical protein C5B59_02900 [Bacteroidota bacterium]